MPGRLIEKAAQYPLRPRKEGGDQAGDGKASKDDHGSFGSPPPERLRPGAGPVSIRLCIRGEAAG